MTQVELARRLSLPQSVISKMETGERQIDFVEVEAICQALGLSLRTFVRRWESAADNPDE